MGAFCRMIQPDWILVDLEATRKEEVISRLVTALEKSGQVLDSSRLYEDVMAREELSSTAIGAGCAVPHAHSPGMGETMVAAARLRTPLDYAAPDNQPVHLVFLMAGPERNTGLHLKVLSKIARILHDPDLRQRLLQAADPAAFHALLCDDGDS